MVVNDLDIRGAGCHSQPLKTDLPLVIDANAVLVFSIPLQGFESVTRQCGNIPKLDSRF
jgi:hypothetical protein